MKAKKIIFMSLILAIVGLVGFSIFQNPDEDENQAEGDSENSTGLGLWDSIKGFFNGLSDD